MTQLRPAESAFVAELEQVRPELTDAWARELPGARAAVLGRLWRSMLVEPLPLDRARIAGPARRGYDTGRDEPGTALRVDGQPYSHPAALLEALDLPGSGTLRAELDHSVVSLALSRAAAVPAGLDDFLAAERSVVDGHPYHPCCRSRPGFSVREQLAYAPEFGQQVHCALLPVAAPECLVAGDWPSALRSDDGILLPVHPWQLAHLPGLPTEAPRLATAPLMSVRTLAPLDGGPHLKTSLSLRMTSAVRDISAASVRNSAALSDLLSALVAKLDGSLQITRNLAAAAALREGTPSPDLAVIVRENPEQYAPPGTRVVPLAALAAHPPDLADPAAWLTALARLLLPPLLQLLDWGAALEAHGQNLLVALDPADRPLLLVYRDLADIRVSPSRLARSGLAHHVVSGHVVDDRPEVLRRKLLGSLVGGALASLVAALGGGNRRREDGLWSAVAGVAREAAGVLGDPGDRRALLTDPLPVKALTLMRLEGCPPGDRWTHVPNPLAAPGASGTGG